MSACRRARRALNTERRELDGELGRIMTVYGTLLAEAAGVPYTAAVLVREHCHAHGWIRGLTCQSCNNTIALAENQGIMPSSAAQAARIRSYLANCPGCR